MKKKNKKKKHKKTLNKGKYVGAVFMDLSKPQ